MMAEYFFESYTTVSEKYSAIFNCHFDFTLYGQTEHPKFLYGRPVYSPFLSCISCTIWL